MLSAALLRAGMNKRRGRVSYTSTQVAAGETHVSIKYMFPSGLLESIQDSELGVTNVVLS